MDAKLGRLLRHFTGAVSSQIGTFHSQQCFLHCHRVLVVVVVVVVANNPGNFSLNEGQTLFRCTGCFDSWLVSKNYRTMFNQKGVSHCNCLIFFYLLGHIGYV